MTGRRPSASESEPCHSIMNAYAKRYVDSVCWTAMGEAANSAPIAPNAGRYMSMANGPSIDSDASSPAKRHERRVQPVRRRPHARGAVTASHRPRGAAPLSAASTAARVYWARKA